jgi:hypothetical protein
MTCGGSIGDYLCEGWRTRADAIRKRDGGRCRGCNRGDEEVRLEVHHRVYGTPGGCGNCVLLGVQDDDLVTLCIDCHDAITNIRRRIRYANREIDAVGLPAPCPHPSTVPTRQPIDVDDIAAVTARAGYTPPRAALW